MRMKIIKISLEKEEMESHSSTVSFYIPQEMIEEFPITDDEDCPIGDFVAEWEGNLYKIHPLGAFPPQYGEGLTVVAVRPKSPMTAREKVGWNLMMARRESGLDIETLAERAGINYITLYKIEEGRFTANSEMLQRIAEAMGKNIEFA